MEIGLIKLYQVTGNKRYLDQAKYFVDARGVGGKLFSSGSSQGRITKRIFPEFADYTPAYSQSHLPVRQQTTAEGHAVRAVYLYCAMADLAEAYGDTELLHACETLWENMTQKRMYITGGALAHQEFWSGLQWIMTCPMSIIIRESLRVYRSGAVRTEDESDYQGRAVT